MVVKKKDESPANGIFKGLAARFKPIRREGRDVTGAKRSWAILDRFLQKG
jgi:hypothetical protein